jgi:hypothetical protein
MKEFSFWTDFRVNPCMSILIRENLLLILAKYIRKNGIDLQKTVSAGYIDRHITAAGRKTKGEKLLSRIVHRLPGKSLYLHEVIHLIHLNRL